MNASSPAWLSLPRPSLLYPAWTWICVWGQVATSCRWSTWWCASQSCPSWWWRATSWLGNICNWWWYSSKDPLEDQEVVCTSNWYLHEWSNGALYRGGWGRWRLFGGKKSEENNYKSKWLSISNSRKSYPDWIPRLFDKSQDLVDSCMLKFYVIKIWNSMESVMQAHPGQWHGVACWWH